MHLDNVRSKAIDLIKGSLERNIEEKAKLEELAADARKRVNIHYEEGDLRENSAYHQAIEDLTRYSNEIAKREKFISDYDLNLLDKNIITSGYVEVLSTVELYEQTDGVTYKFFISPFMESDLENGYVSKEADLVKKLLGRVKGEAVEFKDRVLPINYIYIIKEIL